MTAATDPDRLVFFLQGAHEDDCDGHCVGADVKTSSKAGPGTPHNASILDNLARLLVSGEEKGQAFAIAVVPDTQRSRFIIAENKLVPLDVRRHLMTMLQSLYETRQLVLTYRQAQHSSPVIPIPIPRDATDPVHRKLLELEVSVFRHSWPKLRRRFNKAHRDGVFTDICSAILSLDPDKRLPLSVLQQDGLSVLSQSDRKQLGVIRHIVNQIRVLLVPSTAPSDDVIHKTRVFLADMAQIMRRMESREVPLLRRFASYARALGKQDDDYAKWANKVVSVHLEFTSIALAVGSPTMDTILTETITIDIAETNPRPARVHVNVDNLRIALGAGQNFDTITLQKFLESKFGQYLDTEVQVDGCIHCECAVLATLDEMRSAGVPAIPYVGVSKPSCALCNCYFEAYRAVTGQDIRTRATHGQMVPWRCPSLGDQAVDEQVRSELSTKLRILLVDTVDHYWKRASLSSQSATSDPFIRPTLEDLDAIYRDVSFW
ncbi:hypothetical protein OH76DRAFT_1469266 [Lentinus brumalis]|uniref:Uncharacterized protein n=1 Tax=Lentinus brumalis TaxID=2498619 RepID=A0A371DPZ5_9APHY|nr:hypothetical protein OH76DRAFT_1469266 [Polyporus brumalis]